jgi:ATP-dependent DNA helicase RecG
VNRAELDAIVAGGESDQVEFKRTTGQRSDAARTVCAMLNGRGGFVLFGVNDTGVIRGQEVSARTLEIVVGELRKIEPRALINPETVPLDADREVIVIRVPGGGGGPYTYDGRPYVRQGPTTSAMPPEEYRRLVLEGMHPMARWENQPAHGIGVAELDHAEITRTVDEAIRRSRMEEPGTRDPVALLVGLGLIENGVLLNAAVALFSREERLLPYYPQCVLRMARFRGRDRTEFEDNRQEMGNAFVLLQRAQRFLREHLPVAGRVVPNLFERVDDPLYPPVALREALANALCHRDYGVGGGSVSIGIYDDRLEISSTGRLPFGLTPADLVRPHPSRPWNPLIARVFYRRGMIETWGRGTLKIAELTEQAGLARPEFEESAGEVIVRFFPTGYVPPSRVSRDLSPLQKEILEYLAGVGVARLGQIVNELPSRPVARTVTDNLQTLRELDLVELRGWGKGARWMLRGVDARHHPPRH